MPDPKLEVHDGEVWKVGPNVFVCSDLMSSKLFSEVLEDYPPDVVYCDPPWGQGLANTFRTKAGLDRADYDWTEIYRVVAELGHSHGAPVWVECSSITSQFGSAVPALITHPTAETHRGYWDCLYFRTNEHGLFYAGAEPYPIQLKYKLTGLEGLAKPIAVMRAYSDRFSEGRVMDACAGLGGIQEAAVLVDWVSVSNELNPTRMARALRRIAKLIEVEPEKIS